MPSSGGWKIQHSSVCTEMVQGPFWTLNFDSFEELKFGRSNWSERNVGILWGGVGKFPQPPIGVLPLVVERNSAFGFPGPWKSLGSVGALGNFWMG